MKLNLGLLACACVLAGCAASSTRTGTTVSNATYLHGSSPLLSKEVVSALQSVRTQKASEISDDQRAKLVSAIREMETYCSEKLQGMEAESKAQAHNALALSIAGAIAGSVLVPVLTVHAATNAGAIAGLGGFAGATNFMSQSVASNGFSGSADANTRNQIVTAIQAKLTDAFNEQNSIGTRLDAIEAARANCEFYSIYVPSLTSYTPPAAAAGNAGSGTDTGSGTH